MSQPLTHYTILSNYTSPIPPSFNSNSVQLPSYLPPTKHDEPLNTLNHDISNQLYAFNKMVHSHLAKLQILSLQLKILEHINEQNATFESMNHSKSIFIKYMILRCNLLNFTEIFHRRRRKKKNDKKCVDYLETIHEVKDEEEIQDIKQ